MVLTKELKKYINSLQYVKYRQKYNKFVAEGPKICMEFLRSSGDRIEYTVCTQSFFDEFSQEIRRSQGMTIICNDKELKSISSLKNPNNILIVCQIDVLQNEKEILSKKQWSIFCDKIQDPGNLGAIMRIADWFGIPNVIASEDTVDFYNSKVIQAAMGAHLRLHLHVMDRKVLASDYADRLYVMDLDGSPIEEAELSDDGILVIGNESKGPSEPLLGACRHKVKIKKYGGAESLNASVACGIACHYIISKSTRSIS